MKLSIITINYNNAAGLEKTIESIVSKKTANMEYIVIDGASSDTSLDIILHHKNKIDHWVSESDKGIYNAMNKGIVQAKGEYILFINSGDTIDSDADFDKIISNLTGEDIIYHNLTIASTGEFFIKDYPKQLDFKYFVEDTLPHPASFIKKELFDKVGRYREDLKIVSDWAFFADAVISYNCSYKYIDDNFSTFYLDGISSSPENRKKIEAEKDNHLQLHFPKYYSLYKDWTKKRQELYKIKTSRSVQKLKKLGFLKWLEL